MEFAGTVTVAGTVTAVLLLERLTTNPPLGATAFNVTVQASVPEPVMEPLPQVTALTVVPVPLRLTVVEAPLEELLVRASEPETAPAVVGSNWTDKVAV